MSESAPIPVDPGELPAAPFPPLDTPQSPPDDLPLPPRFSLLTLFGVVTAAAVFCAQLKQIGVYAVVLLLVLLISLYLVPVSPPRRRAKRLVIDLLAGIVLPIGCLYFDPFVFRSGDLSMQMGAYALLGVEMLALFGWLTLGSIYGDLLQGITLGVLSVGCLICLGLGLLLILPAIFGSLMMQPIALLGLVPWFTLASFLPNARRVGRVLKRRTSGQAGFFLGLILLIGIAGAICVVVESIAPHAQPFVQFKPEDLFWGFGHNDQ